jgi:type IV secretory pathway TrbD component
MLVEYLGAGIVHAACMYIIRSWASTRFGHDIYVMNYYKHRNRSRVEPCTGVGLFEQRLQHIRD